MTTEIQSSRKIVQGKQSSDNYPYGRLKCTMTFEIEFNEKKGYRGVSQSVNPKTGRLNALKKGIYYDFLYMTEDENGHFHFHALHINGFDSVEKFVTFLSNNPDIKFTETESQYLYCKICATIKVSSSLTSLVNPDQIREFLEATKYREFIKLFGAHADMYEAVKVGYKANVIKAFKERPDAVVFYKIS